MLNKTIVFSQIMKDMTSFILIHLHMKTTFRYIALFIIPVSMLFGCKDDKTDIPEDPIKNENTVEVKVTIPEGSTVDLTDATVYSLGTGGNLDNSQAGKVPFNTGSTETAYLLDKNNNVLLAGFVTDDRKEISVETTTEVMLYYALDYYLLPASAKKAFLSNVKQAPGFSGLVSIITDLFKSDPLMYTKGAYLPKLNEEVSQISALLSSAKLKRLLIYGKETKSGITISKIDSVHIKLQNSFPRRTKVFVYKKSYYDRNGNQTKIPDYTDNPAYHFRL